MSVRVRVRERSEPSRQNSGLLLSCYSRRREGGRKEEARAREIKKPAGGGRNVG